MTIFIQPPQDFCPQTEAAGCFLEASGHLLYLKRSPNRPAPNTWGIPGGKLEPGEDARSAVIREVLEETGLSIDASDLIFLGPLYVRLHQDYIFYVFHKPFL